jgi:hypothetical protein
VLTPSAPTVGVLVSVAWVPYSQLYWEVSDRVWLNAPLTYMLSGSVMPPPARESGTV